MLAENDNKVILIDQFDKYFKGDLTLAALRAHLKKYDRRLDLLDERVKKTQADDGGIKALAESMLEALCIPANTWTTYYKKDRTIYAFLEHLSRDGHQQASYLLDEIDERFKSRKWLILFAFLLVGAITAAAIYFPLVATFGFMLVDFVNLAGGVPFVCVIFSSLYAIITTYAILSEQRKPADTKTVESFFAFTKGILNFFAYWFWLSTAVMSPTVAGLFIAASVMSVIQEGVSYFFERRKCNTELKFSESNLLHSSRINARYEILSDRHGWTAGINFITSVLVLGVMVPWCLSPPGMLQNAIAVGTLGLIYAVNAWVLQSKEATLRERLQGQLAHINQQENKALPPATPPARGGTFSSLGKIGSSVRLMFSPATPASSKPLTDPALGTQSSPS